MFYIKNFIYLLIIVTFSYAQEDTHIYWDYHTFPETYEEYTNEHIIDFPIWTYERGSACIDVPEENYYICLAQINQDYCSASSDEDMAFIKIDYNGQEIDRNYICEFDQYSSSNDQPTAIAYGNGNLYIAAITSVSEQHYSGIIPQASGYNEYLMKFDLNGNFEWVRHFDYCGAPDSGNPNYCNAIQFRDLEVDTDGNAIILGRADNVYHNNAAGDIYYVSKYLPDGTIDWISMHHMIYQSKSVLHPPNYS